MTSSEKVKAASTYQAKRRQGKANERVLIDGRMVHPDAPHGEQSSYTNYICRCRPCTEAQTVRRRNDRNRR